MTTWTGNTSACEAGTASDDVVTLQLSRAEIREIVIALADRVDTLDTDGATVYADRVQVLLDRVKARA